MTTSINAYLFWTRKTWQEPDEAQVVECADDIHAALGLAGEAGEVVDLIKKMVFTPGRTGSPEEFRDKLQKELGDVLYYWTRLCDQFGFSPAEIISENVCKLEERYGS